MGIIHTTTTPTPLVLVVSAFARANPTLLLLIPCAFHRVMAVVVLVLVLVFVVLVVIAAKGHQSYLLKQVTRQRHTFSFVGKVTTGEGQRIPEENLLYRFGKA